MGNIKYKNSVCVILWQDASYSYDKEVPDKLPLPNLSSGFVLEESNQFVNLATNVDYDHHNDKLLPSDGILIPRRAIIKFKKIGDLNLDD